MRYLLKVLLVVSDMLCLCLAFALGWATRFRIFPEFFPELSHVEQPWALYFELILPGMALLLIFAGREQLYRFGPEDFRKQLFGSWKAVGWLAVVFLAYLLLFRRHFEFSRLGTLFALGYLAVLLPLLRSLVMRWIQSLGVLRVPTLVIGDGKQVESFLEMAGRERYLKAHEMLEQLDPAAILSEDGGSLLPDVSERIDHHFSESGLEKVIIFMEDLPRNSLTTLLRTFEIRAHSIKLVPDAATMALMGARILRHDSMPLLALEQHLMNPAYQLIKRLLDIGVGLLALPFVLLLLLLSIPFLGFKPLMGVKRYDLAHRPFSLLQLRVDYERGGILFQSGLYKLPELLNVLLGRQSLVGPAPLIEREFQLYSDLSDSLRVIRPGLTGLWQVSDYGYFDENQRLAMDMYYIMNWSLSMEMRILFESLFKGLTSLRQPRSGGMRA